VAADAGTIGIPRDEGGGRYTVELVAPRVVTPLDLTLTAECDGGRRRAARLVRVMPPPAAPVEARSGGPLDLPAPAGLLLGHAALAIAVPPGVSEGTTVAVDRAGNRREAPLPLDAPPFHRLHARCTAAGGPRVLVFSVDGAGRPQPAARLVLASPTGQLDAPT